MNERAHIQRKRVMTPPSPQVLNDVSQGIPTAPPQAVNAVPSIVQGVLTSPERPLDAGTRAFMEPRFGHDFSRARMHTDARAAESARAVDALAYTVGRNVVFGTGQYAPGTSEGRRLLAHELTNVVQQNSSKSGIPTSIGFNERDAAENEAQNASNAILLGQLHSPILSRDVGIVRQSLDAATSLPTSNVVCPRRQ